MVGKQRQMESWSTDKKVAITVVGFQLGLIFHSFRYFFYFLFFDFLYVYIY